MDNNEFKRKRSSTLEMAKELGILDNTNINKNHESDLLRLKSITAKKPKKKKKSSKDISKDDLSKLLTTLLDPQNKKIIQEYLEQNGQFNSIDEIFTYIESKKSETLLDSKDTKETKSNTLELIDFLNEMQSKNSEDEEKESLEDNFNKEIEDKNQDSNSDDIPLSVLCEDCESSSEDKDIDLNSNSELLELLNNKEEEEKKETDSNLELDFLEVKEKSSDNKEDSKSYNQDNNLELIDIAKNKTNQSSNESNKELLSLISSENEDLEQTNDSNSDELLNFLNEGDSKDISNNLEEKDEELLTLISSNTQDIKQEESFEDNTKNNANSEELLTLVTNNNNKDEVSSEAKNSSDEVLTLVTSTNKDLELNEKPLEAKEDSSELLSLIEQDSIKEESKKREISEDNKELLNLLVDEEPEDKKELPKAEEIAIIDEKKEEGERSSKIDDNSQAENDELLKLLLEEEGNSKQSSTKEESQESQEVAVEQTGELKINLDDIIKEIEEGNYGYEQEESIKVKEAYIPREFGSNSSEIECQDSKNEPKKGIKGLFKKTKTSKFDAKKEESKFKKPAFGSIKSILNKSKKQKEPKEDIIEDKVKSKSINLDFKKLFSTKKSTNKAGKPKKDLKELFNTNLFKKQKKANNKEQIAKDSTAKTDTQSDTVIKGIVTPNSSDNFVVNSSEDSFISSVNNDSKNSYETRHKRVSGVMEFKPFIFKGETKEFFKIWIVNILLTILTLGVYSAWAKVRTNRYIYSSTYLNGSNFEYNADPKKILYGRAIVVGLYALFSYFSDVAPNAKVALGIFLGFLLLMPWIIRQAISFKLKSASYRNVHFRYSAKSKDFYIYAFKVALYYILAISPLIFVGWLGSTSSGVLESYRMQILRAITQLGVDIKLLGLVALISTLVMAVLFVPALYKQFKDLVINNAAYGETKFKFMGTKKGALGAFAKIAFSNIVATIILGVFTFILVQLFGNIFNLQNINFNTQSGNIIITAGVMLIYLAFIGLYKGINDAHLSNYIRNNTKLEYCEFQSDISAYKLGIIGMTNMIAIVLSFGLLYPWAKMRYLNYKLSHTYFACDNYNRFSSAGNLSTNTIGEETTDFFDIDIGF